MRQSIVVRKATGADANALIELNRACNHADHVCTDRQSVERSLESSNNEAVFIAEFEGQLIGFVCLQIYRSFCYERPTIELTEIYVLEKMRRFKAGTALLQSALEFALAQNALEVNLRVHKNNTVAFFRVGS